jgi:UDP-N-acetylenolpyruvoylglucosamine reductase
MYDITSFEFHEEFEQSFPTLPVKYNVSWREVTSLGAGGDISVLAEPPDDIALAHLLRFCYRREIPVLILGGGTDMVGADSLINCVVIRLCQNDFIRIRPGRRHITAGAGVRLSDLVSISARRGFGGIAPLIGIPGTVGGALRMNAGAFGVSLGNFVSELCGYDLEGNPWAVSGHEIEWGYRCSTIPYNVVVTAAIFKLDFSDKHEEQEKIRQAQQVRRDREPRGRSAGCAFKNVCPSETAGRLLDECGLKNVEFGDAYVSDKHANYVMNRSHASEKDIIDLMSFMRRKVADAKGFYLLPEVCFADFNSVQRVKDASMPPHVVVLKGGNSSEREVSLESGAAVAKALANAGYLVEEIDIDKCCLDEQILKSDVVFPVLHGGFGENGDLQKLLEEAGLRFVGCGSNASALVMDKIRSKEVMERAGVPTAAWKVITSANRDFPAELNFPVVIKPPREGSTVGIFIAKDEQEWKDALDKAFEFDSELLIEEFVKGSEITVGIINGKTLPVIEIKAPGGFYDYDAKYLHQNGETKYLCPPESISEDVQREASELALKFFEAAECRDLLRVDFIVSEGNKLFALEGNSIPGFTSSSLVPKAAAQAGMSFEKLCASLVQAAWKR